VSWLTYWKLPDEVTTAVIAGSETTKQSGGIAAARFAHLAMTEM
jgi:hypothetical protein